MRWSASATAAPAPRGQRRLAIPRRQTTALAELVGFVPVTLVAMAAQARAAGVPRVLVKAASDLGIELPAEAVRNAGKVIP